MRFPQARPPIVRIRHGTFYRHYPHSLAQINNPPLFSNLNFSIPTTTDPATHWYVVGPSSSGKTTFLDALRGSHFCDPHNARTWSIPPGDGKDGHQARLPDQAIQYVGFSSEGLAKGPTTAAYLSARYESKREITDFSLRDFLVGRTKLNSLEMADIHVDPDLLARVVQDLKLTQLVDLPVTFLSNGQGRRARIARALLTRPELLLLDEPFMGLDPPTVASLSPLLHDMARRAAPRLVLSARPQDPIPDWITHIVYLRADSQIGAIGEKSAVLESLRNYVRAVWSGKSKEDVHMAVHNLTEMGKTLTPQGIQGEALMGGEKKATDEHVFLEHTPPKRATGEPLVEMDGCQVAYRGKIALGNWKQTVEGKEKTGLVWTVRRGERWGIFGPNGSGKTTILSLICSDHPQTYSLPIKLFGRSRLPEPGSGQLPFTIWDVQARIGHSSPEIHQLIPRSLTVRQVVENAWADTFGTKPKLSTQEREKVDAVLRWFEEELNPAYTTTAQGALPAGAARDLKWADHYMFGEISFSAQRVALFVRATIKNPDIVVLDEACSGMDDGVRNRCLLFLEHGEHKTYRKNGDGAELVVDSEVVKSGNVKVGGMTEDQALICISHVREEIPDAVREWLCLPEANTGAPARFGRSRGPLGRDEKGWREIWGVGGGSS